MIPRNQSVQLTFLFWFQKKSLEILNGNIENLKETLKSTRSMYSAGMAEATDVDQMVSNVNMVENSRSSLERTIELNYNILRFALGVPANTGITLTETLENLTSEINVEALLSQEFDPKQNVDYKLIEGQELMSSLSLRSEKASILPTLSGFYNYGTNGMGDKVSELRWFQNSMAGLQLSVPIMCKRTEICKNQKSTDKPGKSKNNKRNGNRSAFASGKTAQIQFGKRKPSVPESA